MNTVVYHCLDCQAEFQATQGSKRRYCDACTMKRVLYGKPQEKKK